MNKYEFKGQPPIKTNSGQVIAIGFNRIVHGGRGAYVEFLDEQMLKDSIELVRGSEWRIDTTHPAGNKCYFVLYCPKGEKIRVYHQKRKVDYADYIVGRWYVSPKCLQGFEINGIF
jgi:hypothetical protein